MEVMEMIFDDLIKESEKTNDEDFWSEYAKAYFDYEKMEKMERIKEFEKAYEEMENKDSFNGQYLEVLITQLKSEI